MSDIVSPGRIALYIYGGAVVAYIVLPILLIFPLSLNPNPFFGIDFAEASLRWYREFAGSTEWRLALQNSFLIAGCVIAIATPLGTLAAIGFTLAEFRYKALILGLILCPLMVPHIIIGVGAFFFYSRFGIANSKLALILVHTALAAPFVVLTVSATLTRFNRNLLRAGQSLGANNILVFKDVMLPIIWPGIVSGAIFAFIASFDELIVAIMLAGSDNRTLPRQIWSGVREEISPVITAVAALLVLLSVFFLITLELLRRRAERHGLGARTGMS